MTLPTDAKMGYDIIATIAAKTDGIRNVVFSNNASEADITDQNCGGDARTKAGLRKYTFTCEVLKGSEAAEAIAAAYLTGTPVSVTHNSTTAKEGYYSILQCSENRGLDGAVSFNCSFAYYGPSL